MFCEPRQSCSWHLFMSTLIISSFILTAAGAAATVATSSTPHRRLISFSTLKKLCTWKTSKKKILKSSTPLTTSDEESSSTAIYLYEATFNWKNHQAISLWLKKARHDCTMNEEELKGIIWREKRDLITRIFWDIKKKFKNAILRHFLWNF